MPAVYRVTARGGASIGEADSLDGVVALAKNAPPGRYRIEQLSGDPATGSLRSRKWGVIVKDRNGGISLHLPTWLG